MRTHRPVRQLIRLLMGGAIAACVLTQAAFASPPHPVLIAQTALGKLLASFFMAHYDEVRAAGVNATTNPYESKLAGDESLADLSPLVVGDFNALAILVRFNDNPSSTSATFFDRMLFDTAGITLRDYYRDVSYGELDIITVDLPSSVGWVTAPQDYDYYVNDENGINPESYPNNAQKLVEDLVAIVDPQVDFSEYDNDNNGFVDVLMVVHAGPGAEKTGANSDIWSHKWEIYPRMTSDGVYVSSYTMQPEYINQAGDMTIGVYAHELGHVLGLPDLYDTDYSSNGIGAWGLMGYGSWLGPQGNGGVPAHPCAWSRIQMGFANSTVVSQNVNSQAIEDVKSSGEVFRLWSSGNIGPEYFLVENRQQTGYDTYLPESGLLIWHIDDAVDGNDNEWYPGLDAVNHYLVALEGADGLYELEHCFNIGNAGDVFKSGGLDDAFNAVSAATSDSYTDGASFVGVTNISVSGPTMYADFTVAFASGNEDTDEGTDTGDEVSLPTSMELSQNYPNPFNPTTTIPFYTESGGHATVEIINLLGRKIRTLLDQVVLAGTTEIVWDGTEDNGSTVASGIYLYKLELDDHMEVRKMVLIR